MQQHIPLSLCFRGEVLPPAAPEHNVWRMKSDTISHVDANSGGMHELASAPGTAPETRGNKNGRRETVLGTQGSKNGHREITPETQGNKNGDRKTVLETRGSKNGRRETVLEFQGNKNGDRIA